MPFSVSLIQANFLSEVDLQNTNLTAGRPGPGCHFVAWTNGGPWTDDFGYMYTGVPYPEAHHAGQTNDHMTADELCAVLKGLISASRERQEMLRIYSESPKVRGIMGGTVHEAITDSERSSGTFMTLEPVPGHYPKMLQTGVV